MKHFKHVLIILFVIMSVFSLGVLAEDQAPAGSVEIYRLYLPRTGEHLYTSDASEAEILSTEYNWSDEGTGWYAPAEGDPVYRLYDAENENHLYTTDTNEVDILTRQEGWTLDNQARPLFYSGGGVNVYRLFNQKEHGLHHLTTDENEYNVLPDEGWDQEGVALSCLQKGESFPNPTQVYEDIMKLQSQYPEGMRWTNANIYESAALEQVGGGCHGFALLCSDAAFGSLPGRIHHDANNIRVGDLMRIHNDNHTVVVLKVEGDNITITEGNYGGIIHWGRVITKDQYDINYILTRYP